MRPFLILGIGTFVALSLLGYHRWGTIDAIQRLAVTRALLHEGSVVTRDFGPVKYGPTQPVLMTPSYLIGYGAGRLVGSPDPERVGYRVTAFLFSPLLVSATVALFAYFGACFVGSLRSSVLAALVLLWCTPFLAYARLLFTEPLNAFFLLMSFLLLERSWDDGGRGTLYALLAQVILSLNNFPFIAILLGTITYLGAFHPAVRCRAGRIRIAAYSGVSLGLAAFGWAGYNLARYGSLLSLGYGGETFSTNPLLGLYGLLFSVGRGLVLYAPVTLGVLPLMVSNRPLRWRTRSLGFVFFFSFTCLYAAWGSFEGGWCWGPRFLLPFLPLILMTLVERYDVVAGLPHRQWWFDGLLVLGGLSIAFVEFLGVYQGYERQTFEAGTVDYLLSVFDPRLSSLAHAWDAGRAVSRLPQFLGALAISIGSAHLSVRFSRADSARLPETTRPA
jgi:hypothetical protein